MNADKARILTQDGICNPDISITLDLIYPIIEKFCKSGMYEAVVSLYSTDDSLISFYMIEKTIKYLIKVDGYWAELVSNDPDSGRYSIRISWKHQNNS